MFQTYIQWVTRLIQNLVDVVFPRACLGCKTLGTSLCDHCLILVSKPHENLPDWITAVFTYRDPLIKTAIWKLKYNNNWDVGRVLGRHMYNHLIQQIAEDLPFYKIPIYLIAIPISSRRLRERGYNQSSVIVSGILEHNDRKIFVDGSDFLKRRDMEQRQSHTKNKRARLRNIRDSFIPACDLPPRSHCILIDDVVTTGATLVEARDVLLNMGAKKVSAYTVAH